ncbi:hypothetical protein Pcinc_014921 [Petrolisthes cinctipes]|uniref:Uncharacterized protein n=1 Tax=Petrolisthes cinctipes TaxID=88211 RepID=A0AAE1KSR4_PETCI|nr:hypothetical protein Pcinc_014921 [Petrolisthes cinctipes]
MAGRQDQDEVNKHGDSSEEGADCGKCKKEVKDSDSALECVNQDKQEELDNRVGHLETQTVKVIEAVEESSLLRIHKN